MKSRELRQKRAGLIAQARGILDKGEAEKRDLSQEETNAYDALWAQINTLGTDIERLERQEQAESDLQQTAGASGIRPDPQDSSPGRASQGADEQRTATWQVEQRRALRRFLTDFDGGSGRIELRALQASSDIYGGYLVTPVEFVADLIQAVNNLVFVRQWATVYQVTGADALGVPSLDADPADPTWTSELLVGSEDSTMSFGKRELHPHPLGKWIKVSRTLLRKVPDAEQLVRDRLAYKFAVAMENAYLNGDGAGQPLGVFTASNDGIPTSRDVSTGNAATYPTFDGLIEAKYTLKQQYWSVAKWLMHRDCAKLVAKLKDGDGQYIWRESVRVGEPDRILGAPVFMSEYAPNTFTASLYVAVLGDWSRYWIADALDMDVQRAVEKFIETNQVGLYGRMETDGMPVLAEAFVRVKLAAS